MMRNCFLYQPYYCEENIWQLARKLDEDQGEVWFIINKNRTIVTAQQRAVDADSLVIWDYHVVYYSPDQGVFDLDTRCSFPSSVVTYLEASFLRISALVSSEQKPYFRIIPAHEYISFFSSNRMHMVDKEGHYFQPPPEWSTIGKGNNLSLYLDFNNRLLGEVVSLDTLNSRFL